MYIALNLIDTNPGGEVPLAYVVLTADASKRASQSKAAAEEIKASIIKVSPWRGL